MEADAAGEAECGGAGLADSGIHTSTDGQAEGSGRARAALLVPARVAGPPRPGTIGPPTRLPRNRPARYAGFTSQAPQVPQPRRTAVILSPFGISPGHEGFLRLRHVAYVMLCARLRSQKRSDKEIEAGHVRDIVSVASYTPLKITRPPRSSKARKATWETPQSGLEITAGPCAFFLTLPRRSA